MRSNLCACLLYGLAVASTSYALDNGECGTPEQISAKLKNEGQRSFASADRVERENGSNNLYGVILTISADKSAGYILESDKPTGERASKICVLNRLADIRVFDARKPGIPTEALLKATDAEGRKRCVELEQSGKLGAGTCAPYNTTIQKGEPYGERIMMQGFNVTKQTGSYRKDGTLLTVTGNTNGSIYDDAKNPVSHIVGGIFLTSLPNGATIITSTMVYADYTPYGLSMLEGR